ncbi:hypothetical protein H072_5131 [Dactylellina haptotyla CBS 200.50]|uniref:Ryanodine receptor Ryr domain-containing protein n=1 Tax=Dactylellina haptotyla (strain CBS 200.50) TaxID=1284197 RepID=S8AD87_DACHA|nr:hypothetical protein H072_5131 [Dactylellina haptotyla CBS 200.50]
MDPINIILAGDAPVDVLIYPGLPDENSHKKHMLQTCRQRGGINLISRFVRHVASDYGLTVHEPLNKGPENIRQEFVSSILEFEIRDEANPTAFFSLKLNRRQRLDYQPLFQLPAPYIAYGKRDTVVIQDTEGSFSNVDNAVNFLRNTHPGLLVYHMTRPLASGAIWDTIRNGVYTESGIQDPDKLVVIVSANDLRAEGIQLSHGLSWEKTCEDFVEQLGSVGRLVSLVTCAHLIVNFGCDGVIYHRGGHLNQPILCFDPRGTEGEFVRQNMGDVPGITEAFIAGMVTSLGGSAKNLEECIELGFLSARRLAATGLSLGLNPSDKPEHSIHTIMGRPSRTESPIFKLLIPSDVIGSGADQHWSILDRIVGDPAEVARDIVKNGISSSNSNGIPIAQFGRLVLVDRNEIESFRIVSNVLRDYIDVPQNKPVSIALFGPKGSGRSYAALELGTALLSGQIVSQFRMDLTQATTPADLVPIFHSIRDSNLEGSFPIVYINGFDTVVPGTQLMWLFHLLTPMLHGRFLDNGVSRPIGRAIFFLGSLDFKTYQKFRNQVGGGRGLPPARFEEFVGCLHGYVNMLGPDCVGEHDRLYPVRRAVIVRELLEVREPKLKVDGKISIDENVLDVLLLVPFYRQGIRSLKAIIAMSRLNGCRHFERAALPPASQLDLHVDHKSFIRYLDGHVLPEAIREHLADKIHTTYLQKRFSMGMSEEDRKRPAHQPWSQLPEEFRESARAHADDIPRKLRLISCFLAEQQDHMHRQPITSFNPREQDILAENEHDRWNAERLQKQWSKSSGVAPSSARASSFLVAWNDLPAEWQDVDRVLVASYPRILPDDYKIYRMGSVG